MRSLVQKSIVTIGLIAASVALAGNAMAASTHDGKKPAAAQARPYPNYTSAASPVSLNRGGYDAAARPAYPHRAARGVGPGIDVSRSVGAMFGILPPQYAALVQNAIRESASHQSSGTYEPSWQSPTYDTSPPVDVGADAEQAATNALAAAATQEATDNMAMVQSMQAAEEQNDEANAATLQTEINAGM